MLIKWTSLRIRAAVIVATGLAMFWFVSAGQGATISFNNTKSTDTLAAGTSAGVAGAHVANWNNFTGTDLTPGSVVDSGGTTLASVGYHIGSITGDSGISVTGGNDTGDYHMMKYYDDGQRISIRGLPSAYIANGFTLYIYVAGNTGSAIRTSDYQLYAGGPGGGSLISTSNTITNGPGTNFSGAYALGSQYAVINVSAAQAATGTTYNLANNSNNNNGLGGIGFDIVPVGLTASDGNKRAPVNGIQIVAVPEPTGLGLLALGGWALLRRRRTAV